MTIATFTVLGDPKVKGSAKGFVVNGRARITNDCEREKPWAQQVHWAAIEHRPPALWEGPVSVEMVFLLPRPGRCGKTRIAVLADRRPDVDKLVRSVVDALTGVFWIDDSRVVEIRARKFYADPGQPSGCVITVRHLNPPGAAKQAATAKLIATIRDAADIGPHEQLTLEGVL